MTFPLIFRNTYRKAFVRCPTLARNLYEVPIEPAATIDLHAGAAFARGCEVARRAFFERGAGELDAVEEGRLALAEFFGDFPVPRGSKKTRACMEGALVYYFVHFPLGRDLTPVTMPDGALGIELHFAWPTNVLHPQTATPIPYEGRIDFLAADAEGDIWVVDEKTTSRIGDAWANQWYLDAGQTGYVEWARRIFGERVRGSRIRGIGCAGAEYTKCECIVAIPAWETTRWRAQMQSDLKRWRDMHVAEQYDRVLDHACALYNSPCEFLPRCKRGD